MYLKGVAGQEQFGKIQMARACSKSNGRISRTIVIESEWRNWRLQVDDRPWTFRAPADTYEQCRCEGKPLVTHKAHGHAIIVRVRGRKKAAGKKGE